MNSAIKIVGTILLVSILIPVIFYTGLTLWGKWHDEWSGYNASATVSDGYCNIAVVPIMGEIISYSGANEDGSGNELPPSTSMSDTLSLLSRAESDPYIYGVLALVDSPGGTPVASELIAKEFQKSAMPVAAYILEVGASGAYLAATGADTIIASAMSDVGSIGVSMSYLDYSVQNQNEGLEFVSLSSGKFKDSGSPDKPLTAEERALFERDLKIYHDEFIQQVSHNRNLSIEEVTKLADGSTMPGKLALENKLIDAVGDKETARIWFANELNMQSEEVVFCE
jgi:protease-4